MSDDAFHVHGPHDHQLEHAAEHGAGDRFVRRIAVMTAVLATVGALCAYQSGDTQSAAQIAKNDAAIRKTEAANQWNYYQAKSSKQNLSDLAAELVAADRQERYRAESDRYKAEKTDIQKTAERLEAESRDFDAKSDALMHEHHRWAQAATFLQIAIALSAIALLTRRRWLQWGVYAVAACGAVLGGLALVHA